MLDLRRLHTLMPYRLPGYLVLAYGGPVTYDGKSANSHYSGVVNGRVDAIEGVSALSRSCGEHGEPFISPVCVCVCVCLSPVFGIYVKHSDYLSTNPGYVLQRDKSTTNHPSRTPAWLFGATIMPWPNLSSGNNHPM